MIGTVLIVAACVLLAALSFVGCMAWFLTGIDEAFRNRECIKGWWKRQIYVFCEAGPFIFPVVWGSDFISFFRKKADKIKQWCKGE